MKPLLSIVMANYNYGRFLPDAVGSVLRQCGKPVRGEGGRNALPLPNGELVELIIVDGTSTDGSADVIRNYADSLAWWVSEPDRGQSDAFNKGFAHAAGKYLTWLNADDMLAPGSLGRAADFLTGHPETEWLGGGVIWLNKDGTVRRCFRGVPFVPRFLSRWLPGCVVGGPSSLFSAELFEKAGGFDEDFHFCMDIDLWMRFFRLGVKLKMLPGYLWMFRLHESSKTFNRACGGKRTEQQEKESQMIDSRYRRGGLGSKTVSFLIKVLKFLSFSFLWSFCDTRRWRGKSPGNAD